MSKDQYIDENGFYAPEKRYDYKKLFYWVVLLVCVEGTVNLCYFILDGVIVLHPDLDLNYPHEVDFVYTVVSCIAMALDVVCYTLAAIKVNIPVARLVIILFGLLHAARFIIYQSNVIN